MNQPGWNLTTAMADEAVNWLNQLNSVDTSLPFFLYYAPGGAHTPHHPTAEWDKKISDMHLFDKGWNALRDQIFANQKKLGVIPQDAKLTPWPDDLLKRWDTLTEEEKKLFIRQADVYAAFLAHTDHEIGRVIQAVEDLGKLDNTLIIYISGDNGCSAEGSLIGTPNANATYNGADISVADQMKYYEAWGNNKTYPHFAVPWAWALDTPFKWMKQIPSFFGGVRNGMAISWPARIKDKGGIREQFHHVVDIVPTLLEATGIRAPNTVDGIDQKPIEGVSMVYTFDELNAAAPSTHKTQYFEMMGVQGLYHDGWMLSAVPKRPPWDVIGASVESPATAFRFELYDLSKDWTQFTDLASENPDRVREMTELMFGEFAKHNVLPLDGRSMGPRFASPRPSLTSGRKVFTYRAPVTGIPDSASPNLLNTSYTITAEIDVPSGAEGSIVSDGGRFGGYGLYLLKGRPVFTWNLLGLKMVKWQGPEVLAPGKHTIIFDFKYDGLGFATLAFNNNSGLGRSGAGTLIIDGKTVSAQKMESTVPFGLSLEAVFDIGSKTATPIDEQDYAVPFVFNGKINKVTISVEQPTLTDADRQKLIDAQRALQDAK
jgi:arylsulfatase